LFEEKTLDVDVSQWKKKDLGHFAAERIRKTRGPQRDVFEHRLEAQYLRLSQETAERAAVLCKKHELTGIFLVGPDRLIAPVQAGIPQAFAEFVFLVPEDLGNFSPKELLQRLQPVIDDWQSRQQIGTVTRLLGSDQSAVLDVDETVAQLQNGAIRTLVLIRDLDVNLHQCMKCGLANRSADPVCATCGGQRHKMVLWEILPEMLSMHDTKLEIVSGEAARMLARAGGIGGWLRPARRAAAS
jgi:peptide subunit release factor 1 (eRF1)